MSAAGPLYRVSLYLKGDSLVPDEVTSIVKVEPTKAHRKGDSWLTSTNKKVVERTGLWSLSITPGSRGLNDILAELALTMRAVDLVLQRVRAIEEAYVDVFIATDADGDGRGTCEFDIESQCLSALADLGLPVRFTVAVVRE